MHSPKVVPTMNEQEKLTFAAFSQKLLKYCSNSAHCSVQEKEIVTRFEALIAQRDTCLAHLVKRKEEDLLCTEDISEMEHQLVEAVEFLESMEKRCNLLTLEQLSIDGEERADKELAQQDASEPSVEESSYQFNVQLLNRFLRKYCNLYVKFSSNVDAIRVLSLADHQYKEFDLKDSNVSALKEQLWSCFAASSVHLNSWEQLL
ncbi:uncharacterized protein LOC126559874 [Anopheles maculipalpis]|uniref:uncharacterized protein LOC126559874 n=1 Tax=Anopheles maculipalpis TaxID=1496333 RepID=UPI0021593FB1|nr:uncharacterized protein LOC126559874 [Anopheles maculipalpis]